MFDTLSSSLQSAFRNLRGLGKISESNISDSLREVRMALLEADVNFKVARDFIEDVKQKAIGEKVLRSVHPGQQIVKVIHDKLVELLGSSHEDLDLGERTPASILMVGLHGSGKTTTSGKLAKQLLRDRKKPLLVAADVYRPAAMEQLQVLGEQVGAPVLALHGETKVLRIAKQAQKEAEAQERDVVIYDTAGRLQVDEELIQELIGLKNKIQPQEILLVLDAATGQEAVNVAIHFNEALEISGCILTKLDGDARGGAALSMKAVTGKPIKFVGTGEKLDNFDRFYPDRMAGRILGMGDVVSLVEKVSQDVSKEEMALKEQKLMQGDFTLVDFLDQMRLMRKMGSMESILRMIPGGANMLNGNQLGQTEKNFSRMEAMICSMTPRERQKPQILNARRRKRIAAGSGVRITELNNMLSRFGQMRKMMKKMTKNKKMLRKMANRIPGLSLG